MRKEVGFKYDDQLTGPHQKSDPYPWLADDDPRRYQSDEEIIYEKIDLYNSALSGRRKQG